MLRVALITTDNREDRRDYREALPCFGTAVQALLEGFAALANEIEVHVLSCSRARLPAPVVLAENITFHSLHVPSWGWLKTSYLGCVLAVRGALRRIQPDLVHGQGTERDCALAAVFSGYPNLITVHGNMRRLAGMAKARPWTFAGLTALLEGVAIRRAGGVVCLSSHSERLVAPDARAVWRIPNAVDPAFLRLSRRPIGPVPLILILADLLPNKNLLGFLRTMENLRDEIPFVVRIAGKADTRHESTRAVTAFAENHSWCQLSPFLGREEIREAMAGATCLVLPSLEENLPMVILEAMAARLPVAASVVGGIPDLIRDQETGLLFEPREPESMRAAVRRILGDPEHAARMADHAATLVAAEHSPVKIAREHLRIYRTLLQTAD
jgi:glycosyltransferase involved in cell wall biosynthesis